MWFRVILFFLATGLWCFTFWIATHVSSAPVIFGRYSVPYFIFVLAFFCSSLLLTSFQIRSLYRRIYPFRKELVTLMLSTVAALVIAEVAIRVFDPLGISHFDVWLHQRHLDKITDPVLVYRYRPGYQANYRGIQLSINSLGFREEPIDTKVRGEYRVLLLGDSVTFGVGVQFADTFGSKLEPILASRLKQTVRVINTGAMSYGTTNQLALLKMYGDDLQPDLVILVYVSNDIYPFTSFDPDPWATKFEHASPPETITLLPRKTRLGQLVTFVLGLWDVGGLPDSVDREGYETSMQSLRSMASYCQERKIPFVTFFYRTKHNQLNDSLVADISRLSQQDGFFFSDLLRWFEGRDIRKLRVSVADTHPNSEGHTILAQGIFHFLKNNVFGLPEARKTEHAQSPSVGTMSKLQPSDIPP